MLSHSFQPMTAQLLLKAVLPLAESFVTVSVFLFYLICNGWIHSLCSNYCIISCLFSERGCEVHGAREASHLTIGGRVCSGPVWSVVCETSIGIIGQVLVIVLLYHTLYICKILLYYSFQYECAHPLKWKDFMSQIGNTRALNMHNLSSRGPLPILIFAIQFKSDEYRS